MFTVFYKIVWAVATSFILIASIYFTKKFRCKQFNLKALVCCLKSEDKKSSGISSKEALMLTLAGRIGVGSIAGIALGIYIGGVGSVFWVWVTTFLIAILSYVETYLGVKYREKDEYGNYIGCPSYYIKKGLNNKTLASIYAILIIVCYIGGFLGIQSNTITKSLVQIVPIPNYVVSLLLVVLTFFCIFGGVKQISKITSKMVPFMTLLYVFLVIYVVYVNYTQIPTILLNIIKDAFKMDSFIGGFLSTCIIGLQRGIFSNEAGLGTGSIAASSTNSDDANAQGYMQMLGVYITSLVLCSATAIFILTTNYENLVLDDINGIELMQYAFSCHFGSFGSILLFIFIFLFAFSTVLTGYYYGESSLRFLLRNNNSKCITLLKYVTLLVLFLGGIMSATILWNIVDLLVAFLAIINIYSLFCLQDNISS